MILRNKKGALLLEDIIFLVLNILFITTLAIFLFRQGNGAVFLEQSYSKNIALLIDSAKPATDIKFNMEEAFSLAKKNGVSRNDIVKITGNLVTVKLSEKGGYSYSFFNNVDATAYPDIFPEGNYIIKINNYNS